MCNLSLEKDPSWSKIDPPPCPRSGPPGSPGAIFYLRWGSFWQPANFSPDYSTLHPDLLSHSRERPNLSSKDWEHYTFVLKKLPPAVSAYIFLPTYLFPLNCVILIRGSDYGRLFKSQLLYCYKLFHVAEAKMIRHDVHIMRIFCGSSSAQLVGES